jgi:hypothetical protein
MRFRVMALTLGLFAALNAAPVQAGFIANGSFESGFTDWTTIGNASIETVAFGVTPTNGTNQARISTFAGSVSVAGLNTFLDLTPGTIASLRPNPSQGSGFKQTIIGNAGDVLTFDWNFLTNEPTPSGSFNDFAFWSLTSEQGGALLADTFSAPFLTGTAGFNEQLGYRTTSYTLTTSGTFTLGFGVVDVGDTNVGSALLVDNITFAGIANPTPAPATLLIVGVSLGCTALGSLLRRARQTPKAVA